MYRNRFTMTTVLLVVLMSGLYYQRAKAQCPNGTTSPDNMTCNSAVPPQNPTIGNLGDDTITITSTVNSGGLGGTNFGGDFVDGTAGTGNDTITNDGNIRAIYGDSNSGTGSGNDTITNNGTTQFLLGDSFNGAGSGDDTIINNGTNGQFIVGDSGTNTGSGDDTIINNGTVGGILGDTITGNGTGNDIIINNGAILTGVTGDTNLGHGSGNDTMINNGTINNNMYADSEFGTGSGDDYMENNGTVNGIYGDSVFNEGNGDDVIVNFGTANSITGDGGGGNASVGGNDSIYNYGIVTGNINAGAGDDWVDVEGGYVYGLIDGGAGNDTLVVYTYTFEAEDFFIPAEYEALQQQILAGGTTNCPCVITFVVEGRTFTYTHQNFENLGAVLNFIKLTFTPYDEMNCQNGVKCFALKGKGFRNGNVQIYAAENGQGVGVTTVNFLLIGTSGYSYTNPENGWTVDITFNGTEGDARLYSITLSKNGEVRHAMTQVLAFQMGDQNATTNALAWR